MKSDDFVTRNEGLGTTPQEPTFYEVAARAGWKRDNSIPVQDHAFYEMRGYWRNGDQVSDEYHLRSTLGFGETAR